MSDKVEMEHEDEDAVSEEALAVVTQLAAVLTDKAAKPVLRVNKLHEYRGVYGMEKPVYRLDEEDCVNRLSRTLRTLLDNHEQFVNIVAERDKAREHWEEWEKAAMELDRLCSLEKKAHDNTKTAAKEQAAQLKRRLEDVTKGNIRLNKEVGSLRKQLNSLFKEHNTKVTFLTRELQTRDRALALYAIRNINTEMYPPVPEVTEDTLSEKIDAEYEADYYESMQGEDDVTA